MKIEDAKEIIEKGATCQSCQGTGLVWVATGLDAQGDSVPDKKEGCTKCNSSGKIKLQEPLQAIATYLQYIEKLLRPKKDEDNER